MTKQQTLTKLFIFLSTAMLLAVGLAGSAPAVQAQNFSCTSVTEIPQAECEDLVTLYNSTNGPNWTMYPSWLKSNTPCRWDGVTCSGGQVTRISLYHNDLMTGPIPNFNNLPNLERLDLENNQLSGPIPDFSNLPNLTVLNLVGNSLSGSIPNFSNLSNLTELSLDINNLSGPIPDFSNLPNLMVLELQLNQLSDPIPNFSNLSNLTKLSLSQNQLSGPIPDFNNLPNLTGLMLLSNRLTGTVPNFSNLPNLTELRLQSNRLSGSVPDFSNLPNLTNLDLGYNNLSGPIPDFSNLPNLTGLGLHYNELTGSIPHFSNLPKLTSLYLHKNRLSGTVPNLDWASFSTLWLNNNCGLVAFDAAQATILSNKDPDWQVQNQNCEASTPTPQPQTPTPVATNTPEPNWVYLPLVVKGLSGTMNLIYETDFEEDDWATGRDNDDRCDSYYKDGQYWLEAAPGGNKIECWRPAPRIAEFEVGEVEAEMYHSEGESDAAYALYMNGPARGDNFYLFRVWPNEKDCDEGGDWELYRRENGDGAFVDRGSCHPSIKRGFGPDNANILKMAHEPDGDILIFVNGTLVGRYEDDNPLDGEGVGFYIRTDEGTEDGRDVLMKYNYFRVSKSD